jgi:hypothetical protein
VRATLSIAIDVTLAPVRQRVRWIVSWIFRMVSTRFSTQLSSS